MGEVVLLRLALPAACEEAGDLRALRVLPPRRQPRRRSRRSPIAEVRAEIAALDADLRRIHAGEDPLDPRWLALRDTMRRFPIPLDPLTDLLVGVAIDLEPVEFEDFATLHRYCYLVAGGVGSDARSGPRRATAGVPRARCRPRRRDAAHQRAARHRRGPRSRPSLSPARGAGAIRPDPRRSRAPARSPPTSCG